MYSPCNRTSWDKYMLKDISNYNFYGRSQLVRLRGKYTVQTAHCALETLHLEVKAPLLALLYISDEAEREVSAHWRGNIFEDLCCLHRWQEILWKQRNNGSARKQTKNDGRNKFRKLLSTLLLLFFSFLCFSFLTPLS